MQLEPSVFLNRAVQYCLSHQPFEGLTVLSALPVVDSTEAILMGLNRLGARVLACPVNLFLCDESVSSRLRESGIATVFRGSDLAVEEHAFLVAQELERVCAERSRLTIDFQAHVARLESCCGKAARKASLGLVEMTDEGLPKLKQLAAERQLASPAVSVSAAAVEIERAVLSTFRLGLRSAMDQFSDFDSRGVAIVLVGYDPGLLRFARESLRAGDSLSVLEVRPWQMLQARRESVAILDPAESAHSGDIFLLSHAWYTTFLVNMLLAARKDSAVIDFTKASADFLSGLLPNVTPVNQEGTIYRAETKNGLLWFVRASMFSLLRTAAHPNLDVDVRQALVLLTLADMALRKRQGQVAEPSLTLPSGRVLDLAAQVVIDALSERDLWSFAR